MYQRTLSLTLNLCKSYISDNKLWVLMQANRSLKTTTLHAVC